MVPPSCKASPVDCKKLSVRAEGQALHLMLPQDTVNPNAASDMHASACCEAAHPPYFAAGAAFGSLGAALLSAFTGALPPAARAALPGLPAALACAPATGTEARARVMFYMGSGITSK